MEAREAKFFQIIKRKPLDVKGGAGAGVAGLVGFLCFLGVAAIFFITENYFISLGFASLGLLVYVTGTEVVRVFLSAFTIFFTSRHLVPKAVYIQETLAALKEALHFV